MSSPADETDIDAELRTVFSSVSAGEPLSTIEVADTLEIDRETVSDRLATLAGEGDLETKALESDTHIWWIPPDGTTAPRQGPLEASGSLASRIADAIGDPLFEIDASGTVLAVNDAFTRMLGYEQTDVQGRPLDAILPDDAVEQIEARLRALGNGEIPPGPSLDLEVQTKDGTTIPVVTSFSVWTNIEGGMRGAVGVLSDVSDKCEREKTLSRQQEYLAVLNNLHDIVRDVTAAVLEGSTREEIEQAVCDKLVNSDSYVAAWIAEVDPIEEVLTPRVERGFDGYIEQVEISTDPESPLGQGPAGRAVRTMEPQACRDVASDPTFDPWRETVDGYDFTSCMAIPIVYESTLYGILGVYTERDDAFAEDERTVIGQLGETIGHAISAAERKRAMMSDEIVEIGLQCRRFFESLDIDASFTGTAEFRQTIPIGDGSFLLYGTARDGGIDAVDILVGADETPHYESYDVISQGDEETIFEARLSDAPVPSVVSANGGYVDDVRLIDGDLFIRVHLPPGADINRLVDDIQECYPGIEPITRRQKATQRRTTEHFSSVLDTVLTERQLAALEAGYYAGFFEWPRDSSGEDVAAALDISPATFHQHIRTAERKILDELFEDR